MPTVTDLAAALGLSAAEADYFAEWLAAEREAARDDGRRQTVAALKALAGLNGEAAGVLAFVRKAWNENKHPRDHGKFAKKDGGGSGDKPSRKERRAAKRARRQERRDAARKAHAAAAEAHVAQFAATLEGPALSAVAHAAPHFITAASAATREEMAGAIRAAAAAAQEAAHESADTEAKRHAERLARNNPDLFGRLDADTAEAVREALAEGLSDAYTSGLPSADAADDIADAAEGGEPRAAVLARFRDEFLSQYSPAAQAAAVAEHVGLPGDADTGLIEALADWPALTFDDEAPAAPLAAAYRAAGVAVPEPAPGEVQIEYAERPDVEDAVAAARLKLAQDVTARLWQQLKLDPQEGALARTEDELLVARYGARRQPVLDHPEIKRLSEAGIDHRVLNRRFLAELVHGRPGAKELAEKLVQAAAGSAKKAFDPSEKRDGHGRWTAGAGAADQATEPDPIATETADLEAKLRAVHTAAAEKLERSAAEARALVEGELSEGTPESDPLVQMTLAQIALVERLARERRELAAGGNPDAKWLDSIVTPAELKALWDESKHKRDHGKFAHTERTGRQPAEDRRKTGDAPADAGGTEPTAEPDAKAASLAARIKEVPAAAARRVAEWVQAKYAKLSARYGPTGAKAVLGAMIVLAPTPIPGSSLIPIALAEAVLKVRQAVAGTRQKAVPRLSDEQAQALAGDLLHDLAEEMGETDAADAAPEPAAGFEPTEHGKAVAGRAAAGERLAAAVAHVEWCRAAGTDPQPGLDALARLSDEEAEGVAGGAGVAKAVKWDEAKHPRGKNGRFISLDRIDAAKSDPRLAAKLREEVKPEDAQKLEDALSGKTDVGRTARGQEKHEAKERRQAKEASRAEAVAIRDRLALAHRRGDPLPADDLLALVPHLATMTHKELSDVRLWLSGAGASFGGARLRAERVERLTAWARAAALESRMDEHGFSAEEKEYARATVAGAPEPPSQTQTPAAPSKEAAPSPQPGDVRTVPVGELTVDPARFQFKLGTNAAGVTKELSGVGSFNPEFAGVVSVWRDPADGKTYIVNGHHRHELASRTGHGHLTVRYLQAKDAREARAKGALINIAEGRGTAVDAAKFMRDMGVSPEDLEKHGVALTGKLAGDAATLTRLNDAAFDRVARGALPVETALAVARHLDEPARQEKLFKLLAKREEEGKDLSHRTVEELARQMAAVPGVTRTLETLWGDETEEDDTFVERADLAGHVRAALSQEHNDFGAVASERRAGKVAGAGNTLNVEENKKRAADAEEAKAMYDGQAHRKGAVSDALDAGAVALKQAKSKKERERVRAETLEAVRAAIRGQLDSLRKPAGPAPAHDGGGEGGVDRGSGAGGGTQPPARAAGGEPEPGRGTAPPAGLAPEAGPPTEDEFAAASRPYRPGPIAKSFDPEKHPRDDHGRFVESHELEAARTDPAKADELRGRVTDPAEREKLDAALGQPAEPSVEKPRRRRKRRSLFADDEPAAEPTHTARLADGRTVGFVPHEVAEGAHAADYATVLVDPAKLDAAWALDEGYYIPPGGGGAEIGGRRRDFRAFLATGEPVQAPYVVASGERVSFEDGRHRFSVLRDAGIDRVPVTVPKSQAAEVARRFGAEPEAGH